jgi:hypothetical protein
VKRATWELGEVGFLSLTEIGCDRGKCWRVDLRQHRAFLGVWAVASRRVGFACREMEGSASREGEGLVGEVARVCDSLRSLTYV